MAVEYLTRKNDDGASVGQATSDKISFYGVTPVIQPAATAQSTVATTALTAITSTTLTATDLTNLNAAITRVGALTTLLVQLRADLISLGAIKGSA